ncbi:hypothetical protein GAQ70_14415 [Bacteroides uniformis]|uniref:Transmembrane protein n=1 Tax=Bacteroides uniformis TaxID=820 RepID=A0A6I0J4H2_BACUN|nr:hypothetical protein GAQ70_14415 [Bacteroides uniformis]
MRSTCSCTTCIVYVNLFKDRLFHDCCSFQKADAKVRTLKHIFQIFSEVFFIFLFFSFLVVSLVEREAKRKRKKKNRSPFLERRMSTRAAFVFKSGCKGKDFKA